DGNGVHHAGGGIEILVGIGIAYRLEDRLEDLAGLRVDAARRGKAVDDAIDAAEIRADGVDDLGLDLVRIGVAIERACVEAAGGGSAPRVGMGLGYRPAGRLEDLAGWRVDAARRGKAVDDAIDAAEIRADGVDDLGLDRVRIGVAIERACVEAGGGGFLFESG